MTSAWVFPDISKHEGWWVTSLSGMKEPSHQSYTESFFFKGVEGRLGIHLGVWDDRKHFLSEAFGFFANPRDPFGNPQRCRGMQRSGSCWGQYRRTRRNQKPRNMKEKHPIVKDLPIM